MNSSEAPLLEVDGVVAGYRGDRVLNHVSMHVRGSSVVALLGANGVGKPTLLRSLPAWCPAAKEVSSLTVRGSNGLPQYQDQSIRSLTCPQRQAGSFRPLVRDNLRVASFAKRRRPISVLMASNYSRLRERMNQRERDFSGGERADARHGRALATSPRILLLDEPSLGLAPQMVSRLYAALHSVKQNGVAMLLAEQAAIEALEARRLRVRDRDRRTGPR